METKELKLYTRNLDSYTVSDIEELKKMSDKELDEFQYEIEYATGNTSDWDRLRAVITFRNHIHEWETYANQMKELADNWKGDYYRMYAKFLDKSKVADELGVENRKMKLILNGEKHLYETIDLDYLITIEKSYGELISEHAEMVHFRDVASKYLTDDQLLEIKYDMENSTDT